MRGITWKARILAGTLALAGVVGGASAQAPAPPVAAKVNGVPISMAEFQAVMNLTGGGPDAVEQPADRKKMIQLQALGVLIDEMLMTQFLAQNAPPPSPAEVDKKMAELLEDLKKQGKSLIDFCKEASTSPEVLRKDLAIRLQWTNYTMSQIPDAQLQRYYQEYKEFFDKVAVRVSHIVLRVPQGTPEADKAKLRAQLTEIRNQVLAQKISFAQAAKNWSMCPSNSQGGDIGYIPRKGPDENFARVAYATPVGQISDIVESEYGLHVILVTERKPGQPSDFNTAKEDVRMMCMAELWQVILAEQRKKARIEIFLP